jgi:chemotaxis protein MotB
MSEGDHEQTDKFSDHGDDHEHHAMAHEEDHEGGHDEPWLVSYADLMTLLFGFFVIMYSFATAKNSDEESDIFRIKKEIATYFGGEYINPMESVAKAIQKELNSTATGREVSFLFVGESLELIIQSKVLFSSGSAEIIPSQLPVIDNLLGVIVDRQIKGYQVIIEGHTDDVPISTEKFRSNWDLSAARASTVAMLLENKNYDGSHISIYAFGDNRPLVPNRDSSGNPIELNMAKNRRIVIRLLADKKDTTPAVQKKETEKKAIQEQDKNLEKGN